MNFRRVGVSAPANRLFSMVFRVLIVLSTLFGPLIWAQTPGPSADPAPVLRKLILAESEQKVLAIAADAGGTGNLLVRDLPALDNQDLPQVVGPFLGQPITLDLLNALGGVIKKVAIKHDRIVHLVVPNQPASDIDRKSTRLNSSH